MFILSTHLHLNIPNWFTSCHNNNNEWYDNNEKFFMSDFQVIMLYHNT